MSDDSPTIPLADVLRAANELVSGALIEDYALGGALAAIYYVEPFATYDAEIFFIPATEDLTGELEAGRSREITCCCVIFRYNFWPLID
jgi:hypothetical protein